MSIIIITLIRQKMGFSNSKTDTNKMEDLNIGQKIIVYNGSSPAETGYWFLYKKASGG